MKTRTRIAVVAVFVVAALSLSAAALATPIPTRGVGTATGAYYDGVLHHMTFKLMPEKAQEVLHARNTQFNKVYQYDPGLGQEGEFISVLDAIPGDGFNPIWEEWQITFLTIDPKQFLSDTDVLDAESKGQISLTDTDEMYECSVIGKPFPQ